MPISEIVRKLRGEFPRPRLTRDTFDRDGYPSGRLPLCVEEDIQKWDSNNAAVQASR